MCVAPSMCPCTHSSSSRTSSTTASSGTSSTDTVGTRCGITPSIVARRSRLPRTAIMGAMSTEPAAVAGPPVHRWEVTDEAVYTVTGWLTRTWTLVPISRIQTVDVTRGLLQQLFGLASVAVLTASSQGTVRIWHLEAGVAERMAEHVARRAEKIRDEAT